MMNFNLEITNLFAGNESNVHEFWSKLTNTKDSLNGLEMPEFNKVSANESSPLLSMQEM